MYAGKVECIYPNYNIWLGNNIQQFTFLYLLNRIVIHIYIYLKCKDCSTYRLIWAYRMFLSKGVIYNITGNYNIWITQANVSVWLWNVYLSKELAFHSSVTEFQINNWYQTLLVMALALKNLIRTSFKNKRIAMKAISERFTLESVKIKLHPWEERSGTCLECCHLP